MAAFREFCQCGYSVKNYYYGHANNQKDSKGHADINKVKLGLLSSLASKV